MADLSAETSGHLTVRHLDVTDPGSYELPDDLRVLVNNAGIDTEYLPVEHCNVAKKPTLRGLQHHVVVDN